MKLKELKQKLNEFPPEMDDYEVISDDVMFGDTLSKIKNIGRKILLSFF